MSWHFNHAQPMFIIKLGNPGDNTKIPGFTPSKWNLLVCPMLRRAKGNESALFFLRTTEQPNNQTIKHEQIRWHWLLSCQSSMLLVLRTRHSGPTARRQWAWMEVGDKKSVVSVHIRVSVGCSSVECQKYLWLSTVWSCVVRGWESLVRSL